MTDLYKAVTALIYALVYPWARMRAAFGSSLWRQRLALDLPETAVDVWLHAASVGEVKVIAYLVDYLKERRPALKLHITTVTTTGLATAERLLGDKASVSLFPLDAVYPMRRALQRLRPRFIIVAETEIWPVLIAEASRRGVRIVLVNGRMSPKAFRRYRWTAGGIRCLLAKYDRFFFKTVEDGERYSRFGVEESNSVVAGDMKFDAPLLPRSAGRVSELRARLGVGSDEFLLLAGSTRSGEEEQLVRVYGDVRTRHPRLRLALALRHTERVGEVEALLGAAGLTIRRYSDGPPAGIWPPGSVPVVDVMGVLGDLYQAADLAFVGGTLVDVGGHNILEPVWARTPVVYGPSIGNVREAADYIEKHNYGARVRSADELGVLVEAVLTGKRTFAVRDEAQWRASATALAGDYILEQFRDA